MTTFALLILIPMEVATSFPLPCTMIEWLEWKLYLV